MGRVREWVRRVLGRPKPPRGNPPEPPDDEPALVGRNPRRPLSTGSIALEPPDEPDDVDARGRQA